MSWPLTPTIAIAFNIGDRVLVKSDMAPIKVRSTDGTTSYRSFGGRRGRIVQVNFNTTYRYWAVRLDRHKKLVWFCQAELEKIGLLDQLAEIK
jgi:hypothetical protein